MNVPFLPEKPLTLGLQEEITRPTQCLDQIVHNMLITMVGVGKKT